MDIWIASRCSKRYPAFCRRKYMRTPPTPPQKHAVIDPMAYQTLWTPLTHAARHNNVDCVEYLLRSGGELLPSWGLYLLADTTHKNTKRIRTSATTRAGPQPIMPDLRLTISL